MTRLMSLTVVLSLAACSSPTAVPRAQPTEAASATPAAAPTADALAAKAVAQRYFSLLRSGDLAGAHDLWSAGTGGTLKEFIAAQRRYRRYDGEAAAPTAVKTTDGQDYILVAAKVHATSQGGKPTTIYGVVMLKRLAKARQPWQIWGLDIRPRHCRAGERPSGLSCVRQ